MMARSTPPDATAFGIDPALLGLPQLFSAAEAAEILRRLGLAEMTECGLRTRAYRRQVPFHMNGRRIRFTASDLREIIESHARRPTPAGPREAASPNRRESRRSSARTDPRPPQAWRARKAPGPAAAGEQR